MLRLICYVSKAAMQEETGSHGSPPAREVRFIAVTGRKMRGRRWQKCLDQTDATRKMTENSNGRRERVVDAWPVEDAAQSVTHLDVLARVVAS